MAGQILAEGGVLPGGGINWVDTPQHLIEQVGNAADPQPHLGYTYYDQSTGRFAVQPVPGPIGPPGDETPEIRLRVRRAGPFAPGQGIDIIKVDNKGRELR